MGRGPPAAGDGFTYEHLADRSELWLDFCADTGDGGNSTYAVARALAAPRLHVTMPAGMAAPASAAAAAGGSPTAAASVRFSDDTYGGNSVSGKAGDVVGPGLDYPRGSSFRGRSEARGSSAGAASGEGPAAAASVAGGGLVLPRGDVMVIGGDLAYPNPSIETYEHRLFRPFEAALPPPPNVHHKRLVVNKPDLPRVPQVTHHRTRNFKEILSPLDRCAVTF